MPVLITILIVVPLAELFVIIQVGSLIGAIPTIALLLLFSISGGWLVRREGRAAWSRLNVAISAGKVPARETADGVLVVVAGALLLTPGFLTDACGILLLLPAVRKVVRVFGLRRIVGGGWPGFVVVGASTAGSAWSGRNSHKGENTAVPPQRSYDVDGVAVDVDPPTLDR
ncbi:MAG: FxsA family protein [Solirubrobacterales bacterium]|nr:FxsA family protein [Solirubrobacterales bacterium]